jgi:hypothetical protein
VRLSWEANVTTWNLGPLGYEYSRSQLQQLLTKGQAVVMVQEVRFSLGARQRVKNELKHQHPEYYCFLEAGKDPLSSDGDGMDTERPKSPWCHRGHFAVATFLQREVFRSAQRREWHVEADKKTLRHMARGRVLRVDAELHDGQRLQVFNVHQATSGDMQLQQHTWQVLAKSIMECPHQRILLDMSSTIPLPPREHLCNRYCSNNCNKHTRSPASPALGRAPDTLMVDSSILVLPCLDRRSETGTTRMTSGLTGTQLHVYVSGSCGWSRAQEP